MTNLNNAFDQNKFGVLRQEKGVIWLIPWNVLLVKIQFKTHINNRVIAKMSKKLTF